MRTGVYELFRGRVAGAAPGLTVYSYPELNSVLTLAERFALQVIVDQRMASINIIGLEMRLQGSGDGLVWSDVATVITQKSLDSSTATFVYAGTSNYPSPSLTRIAYVFTCAEALFSCLLASTVCLRGHHKGVHHAKSRFDCF